MKFLEDYDLASLLPSKTVVKIYDAVISKREGLATYSKPVAYVTHGGPASATLHTPRAAATPVKVGRARSPLKSGAKTEKNEKLVGSPAFKPAGKLTETSRKRETEWRERSASISMANRGNFLLTGGSMGGVENMLRLRASSNVNGSTGSKDEQGTGNESIKSIELNPTNTQASFTEFIEIITDLTVVGMSSNKHLHAMYPTAYDKTLAMLAMWGVGDIRRIQEARFMEGGKG